MAHWTKPNMYINRPNNPKNFATGCEKLAPKKKLNRFFKIPYKFIEGCNQIWHWAELIKEMQLKSLKLWIKKFKEINVKDHLHTLVVVVNAWLKLYSLNSSLISFQNQTDIVIINVEIFVIRSAKLYSPMKRIRLIKKRSDIFQ